MRLRNDILLSETDIRKWIAESQPKSFICKQIKCKPETLNFWLNKMDIKYDGNRNFNNLIHPLVRTSEEYIKLNAVRSCVLKEKLIKEGKKEHRCEKCTLTEWNGLPIPLELHHLDGDRFNNELSNLQVLCCNCHAQTDNWRGKNTHK